ncbi:MAG: NifU family protein [Actinomadura sp.]
MNEARGGDGRPRAAEGTVAGLLSRLDETLERLERTPGATAETALEAVTMLTEVYGEALSRMMAHVPGDAAFSLVEDDLVGHLLVLHDLHPEPVERRVARTLERLRPDLRRRGLDAELVAVEGSTARVGLAGKGGGCAAGAAEEAVREAVLAAAPELSAVEVTPPKAPPAFVPLDALARRPAAAPDGAA